MPDMVKQPVKTTSRISMPGKALLSILIFSAGLLCAEAAIRLRSWWRHGSTFSSAAPMVAHDPRFDLVLPVPNATRQGSRESIHINSLGFRGKEFSKQKNPGTIRILCVGASTTFGTGSSTDSTTWPAYLEMELLAAPRSGDTLEVINAGIQGCRIQHTIRDIERRLLAYQPDIVICYHANNDIAEDTRRIAQTRGLTGSPGLGNRFINWASQYSQLVDLAQKNLMILQKGGSTTGGRLNGIPEDLAASFSNSLNELVDLTEKHRVRLLLTTFPVKYRRHQEKETRLTNADVAFYYMPWMSMDDLLDAMDMYNQAILNVASARDVPVVDLRESVPADATHFVDCMHMTDRGCQIVARELAEAITHSGMLNTRGENESNQPEIH